MPWTTKPSAADDGAVLIMDGPDIVAVVMRPEHAALIARAPDLARVLELVYARDARRLSVEVFAEVVGVL